jgi:hypothetical protein
LRKLRSRVERDTRVPALVAALSRRRAADSRAEADAVARELFRLLAANRIAIRLLDRCGADFPELAALWWRSGRGRVMRALERWLRARAESGQLAPLPDPTLTARITLEVAAYWAVHRHWDPAPDPRFADEPHVEDGVVAYVTRALHGGSR